VGFALPQFPLRLPLTPASPLQEAPGPEDGSEREKPVEEAPAGGEKEEEEAFLVSLYQFMKERRTPIERIPHLGFKQSTSAPGPGAAAGASAAAP